MIEAVSDCKKESCFDSDQYEEEEKNLDKNIERNSV